MNAAAKLESKTERNDINGARAEDARAPGGSESGRISEFQNRIKARSGKSVKVLIEQ
jgi:hypothetical protein